MIFFPLSGRNIFEPPRYLTVNDAIKQLLEVAKGKVLKEKEQGQQLQFLKRQLIFYGTKSHLVIALFSVKWGQSLRGIGTSWMGRSENNIWHNG